MRLCRFEQQGKVSIGYFADTHVLPLEAAARLHAEQTRQELGLPPGDELLPFLPRGFAHPAAWSLSGWLDRQPAEQTASIRIPIGEIQLLLPIPRPNKLFLLAGNYADHIREGGGVAAERSETFPYVFMKPPTTTLTRPGDPLYIPSVSPNAIDWELELAVVMARRCRNVSEAEALNMVAGYTIVNDISDRKFRPNPQRRARPKDEFFDWLHGKWHDSFCPCGPCVTSADAIPDPQQLTLQLRLNGELRQDSSTANQVFPVAAVIAFISSFVTLEPGDIISTGTPAGVGNTTGTYLHPGDRLEGTISQIGTLVTPVVAEPH